MLPPIPPHLAALLQQKANEIQTRIDSGEAPEPLVRDIVEDFGGLILAAPPNYQRLLGLLCRQLGALLP